MITYDNKKGYRRKSQFSIMYHYQNLDDDSDYLIGITKDKKWISYENWDKKDCLKSYDICKSIRAFRRKLRKLGKLQPELKGKKFILISKFSGGFDAFGVVK